MAEVEAGECAWMCVNVRGIMAGRPNSSVSPPPLAAAMVCFA